VIQGPSGPFLISKYFTKNENFPVVPSGESFHHHLMSEMTRDEMKMYLETARAEAKASAAEVSKSQADLRADFKAGMAAVSVDVANLKIDFSNLKSDFSNLKSDFSDLKSDLHATFSAQTKWIAAMGFGIVAAVATINSMLKPESVLVPQPATTQSAPPYANAARAIAPAPNPALPRSPLALPGLSSRAQVPNDGR
jgi:hypothetical protein